MRGRFARSRSTQKRVPPLGDGSRHRLPPGTRISIVGGGLAGLAAATVLAERGGEVTVFEKSGTLGGRLASWEDRLADGTEFQMERGFHAFFRQYYNLRRLMKRIDPQLTKLKPLDDYPLIAPQGTERFHDLPSLPPFNVIDLVRRSDAIGFTDLRHVNVRRAMAMLSYDPTETYRKYDQMTAREYLDSLRFPPGARQQLFDVFSHSFFNPEDEYSAAELLMNFHFYFMGNPEGLVFDVLTEPFSHGFIDPLARYLRSRGVDLRCGAEVTHLEKRGGTFIVTSDKSEFTSDYVVLALNVPGLQKVIGGSESLAQSGLAQQVAELELTRPFAVWRLWLDRKLRPGRPPFVGTTGFGLLDNISIYEQLETESRDWSDRTGGSVIELHAYAVPPGMNEADVRADLFSGMTAIYPEAAEANVVEERFLLRQDCPAFKPGTHKRRPSVRTDVPNLWLAGDFLRLEFPSALMERAVASGFVAANHLLSQHEVEEEAIFSVAPRGICARPQWLRRASG